MQTGNAGFKASCTNLQAGCINTRRLFAAFPALSHNRDTGQYRGTQVLDDSRGLGVTEYLPVND